MLGSVPAALGLGGSSLRRIVGAGYLWPGASFTRSSGAWGVDASGALASWATDAPRFVGSSKWLRVEGQRTNAVRNPRGEGATPGVLGSGGVMPTTWTLSAAGGVTVEVIGAVVVNGVGCLRLSITGTATSTANLSLLMESATSIVAAQGQVWSGSVFLRRDPGTNATPSVQLRYTEHNSSSTQLAASAGIVETVTASLSRVERSYTTAQAACAFVRPFLTLSVVNGSTYTTTLDVGWPQMEQAPFASSPILPLVGTQAVSSRSQDNVTLPLSQIGTAWNRQQGVIVADIQTVGPFTSSTASDWLGVCSAGTAQNYIGLAINPAHTAIEARIVVSGVAQPIASVTISPPPRNTTFRVALAWSSTQVQVAARGVVGTVVAITALPVPTQLEIGRLGTGNPLFGAVSGLDVQPAAIFGTGLAALT